MLVAEMNYVGAHFAHIVARDDYLRLERKRVEVRHAMERRRASRIGYIEPSDMYVKTSDFHRSYREG